MMNMTYTYFKKCCFGNGSLGIRHWAFGNADLTAMICFSDTKQQLLSAQCIESSTFLLLFFRACLSEHIRHATDPEVQCPHQDENYACHATITGQEIQAVSGLLNGGE